MVRAFAKVHEYNHGTRGGAPRAPFQLRPASTPNNQCRDERERRDAAGGEHAPLLCGTPSAAPHGTRRRIARRRTWGRE